jgi:hypothetical protein
VIVDADNRYRARIGDAGNPGHRIKDNGAQEKAAPKGGSCSRGHAAISGDRSGTLRKAMAPAAQPDRVRRAFAFGVRSSWRCAPWRLRRNLTASGELLPSAFALHGAARHGACGAT